MGFIRRVLVSPQFSAASTFRFCSRDSRSEASNSFRDLLVASVTESHSPSGSSVFLSRALSQPAMRL